MRICVNHSSILYMYACMYTYTHLYSEKLRLGHDVAGQVDGDVAVDIGDRELLDEEPAAQHGVVASRGPVVRRKLCELTL